MLKKCLTKIVCTIGPSTDNEDAIRNLVLSGMTVARLNFSHGTQEKHLNTIKLIRKVEKDMNTHIGIGMDTKGPEIRIKLKTSSINVKKNDELIFSTVENDKSILIPKINIQKIQINDEVFLDDSLLKLKVIEISESSFKCVSTNDHVLKNNKTLGFQGKDLDLPYLSEKDRNDIIFGVNNGVDYIFASFISKKEEIQDIRELINGKNIFIVSKIERREAMHNLRDIVSVSDGVMVARGDLGVDLGLENLFSAQKQIFKETKTQKKPLICATQMIESMVHAFVPTRAEVSDIGNAVLDNCDCVMLSAESASGAHPVKAVEFTKRICLNAEKYKRENNEIPLIFSNIYKNVEAIIMYMENMNDISCISSLISTIPTIVISNNTNLLRRLCIYGGVWPLSVKNIVNNKALNNIKEHFGISGKVLIIDDNQIKIGFIGEN